MHSLLYGWAAAIVAGLVVGVCAVAFGIPEGRMIAISTPAGIVFGVIGLSLPWARQLAVARVSRSLPAERRRRR